jgi:hypothetical protein
MTRIAWLASLPLALALMLPFESDLTLIAGLLCLLAFIVLGVLVIAEPAITSGDDQAPAQGGADASNDAASSAGD